jgi:glycosyltransferase involved in cell wall biosynthesis
MVIAVKTKITGKDEVEENDNFIFEAFRRIIKLHSEHNFILISEKKLNDVLTSFDNVTNVATGEEKKNPVSRYLWYNIKIPAILKKYKADVFISCDGIASLATKVSQCIIGPDLTFIHQPSFFKKSALLFYKTFIPRSLKKAKLIFTFSEFCKTDIIKQYKINDEKIKVVNKGINENFKEISYEEREAVKAKYTNGNEYFIYTGEVGIHKNLLNLLKAFSAFKKRQKSSMQLLIAGKQEWKYEDFLKNLCLFKFKDDVKILKDPTLQELVEITAAAYAMVHPSLYESFATQPLEAMRSGIPVINSSKGAMCEICGDAALYADMENFKEIAVKMMQLFKDENLRKELIEKGKIQAEKFNWGITSYLLWENVEKILQTNL